MDVVIGMTLAFLLGAYVRQPFALTKERSKESKDELTQFLEDEAEAEKKRQIQIYKALQWNGKKVDYEE